jgi:hypothetical protein
MVATRSTCMPYTASRYALTSICACWPARSTGRRITGHDPGSQHWQGSTSSQDWGWWAVSGRLRKTSKAGAQQPPACCTRQTLQDIHALPPLPRQHPRHKRPRALVTFGVVRNATSRAQPCCRICSTWSSGSLNICVRGGRVASQPLYVPLVTALESTSTLT